MTQPKTKAAPRPAFEDLYEEFFDETLRYARSRMRDVDPEVVRDLVSDVWLKILETLPTKWQNRGLPIGAWIYKLTRNAIIDWVRARKSYSAVGLDPETHDSIDTQVDREYLDILSTEVMDDILAALAGGQREVIRLVYVEGWRLTDVAQHYGISLGAAKKLHWRALGRIRTYLETGATRRKRRVRVA